MIALKENFGYFAPKKYMKYLTYLPTLLFLCLGCGNATQDSLLQDAFSFHEKSLMIRESLEEILQQGDNLSEVQRSDLQGFLEEWDQSFVEVPGFEHAHDHDHDHGSHDHHHHHHAHKAPDLTPEQHFQLQQHLYESLLEVYGRVKK